MNPIRRLIEDFIPIREISAQAAREKSIRKGHISTLHLWWARRPLVAARAAVFASLVAAPETYQKRACLKKTMIDLCRWEAGENTIARARKKILEAQRERLNLPDDTPLSEVPPPKVLDMFAGGGAIPLEALRLGCETYAVELNPVAHIIELCTLVYPQKYGNKLADEVEKWGNWVIEKVRAEIGDLYPLIKVGEVITEKFEQIELLPQSKPKQLNLANNLTPVAYLWTRTVKCPNPACGASVPLVRQTWLCKKKNKYVALKVIPNYQTKQVEFEVVEATTEKGLGFDPSAGSSRGTSICRHCGTTIPSKPYIQEQGKAGKISHQLMAIVCTTPGTDGKTYLSGKSYEQYVPDEIAIKNRLEQIVEKTGISTPSEPVKVWSGVFNAPLYGLDQFEKLFTSRQLLALMTFVKWVRLAHEEMMQQGYEEEFGKAIATYLGIMCDRIADRGSTICRWDNGRDMASNTFARQALPMVWDFAENNPLGNASGNASNALDWILQFITQESVETRNFASLQRGSAMGMSIESESLDAVITDPPYFDSVPYADLSDFFYVWLKRSIGHLGDRVLQLRTPFGGGKTHSLVSLYHIATNRHKLQFPELATLPDPGLVKVAIFIGTDISASTGIQIENGPQILTPWGYLAWQIGGAEAYALVETEDQQRIAPGSDLLRKIFGDKSILLLMDEFLVYVSDAMGLVVGDTTFGRQVLTFVQKLTEVVRDLPKTVLVYSLQASVQEAVGDEGLLNILDKLVSRIDAKREPVSGDEVMKIIQRRLFANVGDPDVIQEIARQQAELFRRFRESYEDTNRGKQEVQQQADLLAERIQSSYPFHPDLLDLMYHRWGSLPSYQRTRGALQFLARVVYALRQAGDTSLLIGPGNIPFDDEGVRGAFFSQVGERERFSSVIAADLIGRKAKVKAVDNRIAQDAPALASLKVGTRLASGILLYSFGVRNGEDRGVVEQEVIAACLAPGLDRNTITATLSDLREQLLYLHYVGRRYRFETKPNLNKLVADEEGKIAVDDVLEKIRVDLSKSLQNSRGKVVLWPKDSMAIADHVPQFSIVYLNPDWAEKSPEVTSGEALNWLEQRGKDKREYKNAIAFVVSNKVQMDKARKGARTALAIASLLEQKVKYKFTVEDTEELNGKAKDAASEVNAALRRLYEYILLPLPCQEGNNPIRLEMIDLQSQLNTSQNLQDRVLDALKNHVFDSITPAKLVQHSSLENSETGYIKAEELVSYFFRFPTLPKMLDVSGIQKAVIKAIERGLIGYIPSITIHGNTTPTIENTSLISFEQVIPVEELDLSGYLLSPWLVGLLRTVSSDDADTTKPDANDENSTDAENSSKSWGNSDTKGNLVKEEKETVKYNSKTSSVESSILVDIVKGKKPARYYKLNLLAKKSQIFQIFELLQTLSDKANEMTIQIEVQAHTQQEFDRNWIRNAIEEVLDEMDIQASTHLE